MNNSTALTFSNMLRLVQINATLSAIIISPLAAFVRFVLVLFCFVLFTSLANRTFNHQQLNCCYQLLNCTYLLPPPAQPIMCQDFMRFCVLTSTHNLVPTNHVSHKTKHMSQYVHFYSAYVRLIIKKCSCCQYQIRFSWAIFIFCFTMTEITVYFGRFTMHRIRNRRDLLIINIISQ